ncbi:MAG: hypothetical protein IT446_14225 [Phycisphaerales bacterium]|nr:hypothetical protein [Phycisphaerales bacterium]
MNLNIENIPEQLRQYNQWVPWRYEQRPGEKKPRKMPKLWNSKGYASVSDPNTWTTLENAIRSATVRGYDGVAFVFTDDDPYTFFDLDKSINEDGILTPEAQAVVDLFQTYTEISPSGRGVKGVVEGTFTGTGINAGWAELYTRRRMFCLTGKHLAGTPKTIVKNQAAIDELYRRLRGSDEKPTPRTPVDPDIFASIPQEVRAERCWECLKKLPDAISGEGGHNRTFQAACECYRHALDDETAREVLLRFNAEKTGGEQWTDDELRHKLEDARKEVEKAGEFGCRLLAKVVNRRDPLPISRRYRKELHHHAEHPTLIFSADDFHSFGGVSYSSLEPAALRQQLYAFLEPLETIRQKGDLSEIVPFRPTGRDVDTVIDALKAVCYSPVSAPAWIGEDAERMPDPAQLILAPNGVWSIGDNGAEKICDPTPRLFAVNALDYPLIPDAAEPKEWLKFSDEIFEGDQQQIDLLQEWIGYVLTADTRLQKILLCIGPPRSGKGTIARIITRIIGADNVCAPTLAGLATNFGLWPLIGKMLAIIGDARLSGRTDQAIVIERLLSISGEDSLTIDRKNQSPLTQRLLTRLMILSNELPKLADASSAIANRFLILSLKKSFLGDEDIGLTDRLLSEVPQIAAWAIQGLIRLREQGRFTEPAAADELRREMTDLGSPISAFIRDWCRVAPGQEVLAADLFGAWNCWCDEQGNSHPGTVQTFGRDLRAALPNVKSTQPRQNNDTRARVYLGIGLTPAATETLSVERAKRTERDNRRRSREEVYA